MLKKLVIAVNTGYEIVERMAFNGISANLVVYLARKLHEGTVKSSNNVTNWTGTLWLTPILGAYIADTYLGRYWTFVFATSIYIMVIKIYSFVLCCSSLSEYITATCLFFFFGQI